MNTLISANETFQYKVKQQVANGYSSAMFFKSFVMEDTLEPCLDVVSAKVQRDGQDCEDFQVEIQGQKVMATAKADALNKESFYGHMYTLVIEAKIDKEADITPYLNTDKSEMTVPNKATVTIDDEPKTTTETRTKLIMPELAVTKDVNRYEHQVGEKASYTITAKQTKEGATAVDVIVKDTDLPEGFSIVEDSMKVSGIDDYDVKLVEGGFELTTAELPYGKTITIQFDAMPTKEVNGTIIDNTVTADSWQTETKEASASVYVNSPKMDIQKSVERKGYAVGETVDYTLELTQLNEGCFMRNVELTDTIQTDGVKLLPGTLIILDKNNKDVTDQYDVTFDGNKGFTIKTKENFAGPSGTVPPTEQGVADYKDLTCNTYLKIQYSAKLASDDLAGLEVQNIAVSPATENTNGDVIKEDPDIPSGGDETELTVPVKGAELKITKDSDKKQYAVGETGEYTVNVEQIRPDYTAKNVVIKDAFEQKEGLSIDADSIKVKKGRTDITEQCKITVDEDGTGYQIQTNNDLAYGEEMTVTYNVTFTSETLVGTDIVNVAVTSADNASEKDTDHTVTLTEAPAELRKDFRQGRI